MSKNKKKFSLRVNSTINPIFPCLCLLPALAAIVIFDLFPALVNIGMSFTNFQGYGLAFNWVGFENYGAIFGLEGKEVFHSLFVTLKFTVIELFAQQLLSLGVALLIAGKLKGKNFFRVLFFMPTILGVTVIGFIWLMIFDPISGPVAVFLQTNFNIESSLLGDSTIALYLCIFVVIWTKFGYSMVIYISGLQNIPEELKEAARIDGANGRQVLFNVTLPMLRPALVICFWLGINSGLTQYAMIFTLTNGNADTTTFSLYFFKRVMNASMNKGETAALSMLYFVLTTVIMLTFNHFFRRKENDAY